MRIPDSLGWALEEALDEVFEEVNDELEETVMKVVAQEIGVTIRREMRRAGINRSEETGTQDKRSESEKAGYRKQGGSILDTQNKIESYDEDVIAFGGVPVGRDYRARFRDQGIEEHYLWDYERQNPTGSVDGVNYLEKAAKVITQITPRIIDRGITKALLTVKTVVARTTLR